MKVESNCGPSATARKIAPIPRRKSTHFNDMGGFDFFDAIDCAAAVQQEFGLVIPEHELASIQSVSDLGPVFA